MKDRTDQVICTAIYAPITIVVIYGIWALLSWTVPVPNLQFAVLAAAMVLLWWRIIGVEAPEDDHRWDTWG